MKKLLHTGTEARGQAGARAPPQDILIFFHYQEVKVALLQ